MITNSPGCTLRPAISSCFDLRHKYRKGLTLKKNGQSSVGAETSNCVGANSEEGSVPSASSPNMGSIEDRGVRTTSNLICLHISSKRSISAAENGCLLTKMVAAPIRSKPWML